MLDEKTLKKQEDDWSELKPLLERKTALENEKASFKSKNNKHISTTKLLILFLFINCTLIEIFTGYITMKSFSIVELTGAAPDFTPLVTLIGAVVSEVIGFAVYALKSIKENTIGGIIYDSAMAEMSSNNDEEPVG